MHDGFSQAKQRREIFFRDQHGRKVGAVIELATGDPTGPLKFPKAPIVPPAHCVKIVKDPERPFTLEIDYDRIIREGREAIDEYETSRSRFLRAQPNANELDIEKMVGKRPPAVEPWIAAKQGDKWTLGLTDRVNVKVAQYLDLEKNRDEEEYDFTAEENYLDLEESADKEALGGKRVPVRQRTKTKPVESEAA